MKTVCLAALILACVASMHGVSDDEPRHSERVAAKPPTKTGRSEQAPLNHERAGTGNGAALHQPPSVAAGTTAGLVVTARPIAVRPSSAVLANRPSVNHHSANPAAVGGPPSASSRNTAAINGTRMPRRR